MKGPGTEHDPPVGCQPSSQHSPGACICAQQPIQSRRIKTYPQGFSLFLLYLGTKANCHVPWPPTVMNLEFFIESRPLPLEGSFRDGLECPQPATSHGHRIPSCERQKGHFQIVVAGTLKAFLQCKNSKSKIHAIMSPTSCPSKTNTTYCYLIPCILLQLTLPTEPLYENQHSHDALWPSQSDLTEGSLSQGCWANWGRAYSKWRAVHRLPRFWENIPIKEKLHQKSPFIHVFLRTASLWQQHLALINTETSLVSLKMNVYWRSC